MTAYVIRAGQFLQAQFRALSDEMRRLLFVAMIALLAFSPTPLQTVVLDSLVGAYLSVSVFVAFTLFLIYGIERLFHWDIAAFNASHPRLQILISAFLGALPGCGGAIMVLTQFVQRKVSFGAIIAALTATMGDAAFLLIAKEPMTGLAIIAVSLVAGSLMGWLVDHMHGRDFLQVANQITPPHDAHESSSILTPLRPAIKIAWWLVLIPGVLFGILNAMQWQIDTLFAAYLPTPLPLERTVGLLGLFLCLILWAIQPRITGAWCQNCHEDHHLRQRVEIDTNFITYWVVMAFLGYEITIHLFHIDLASIFKTFQPLVPLMAILIGFIPGCGPQILVTTLYVNGVIPLSAQIGNAISNDGDALFPAIAIAPKAAIIATLYSSIPAFILAYGYYFWFE